MARGADYVLLDTAGRLHTKQDLMKQLEKINRVIKKKIPDAPHEVMLVMDATAGQNGLSQAKTFYEDVGVTGTQLDQSFDLLIGVDATRGQKPLVNQDHVQWRLALNTQAIGRHL